jgi:radical SAM protein with 4Fe4S-binding SPASM domain
MPFCFAPWSNLDIDPQGNISPCCKFQHKNYNDQPLNINQNNLQQYVNSRTMQIIREEFLNDQWPKGCERCHLEEDNGIKSKRQLDFDRWHEHYQTYDLNDGGLLTASVAFGNTCNLTCITCGPFASSRWRQEYLQLHQQNITHNDFYKRGFVDDILNFSPNIIHLDIPGGEPFLSGVVQQQELLTRLIDQGRAKDIAIHYTTNATSWPNERWWKLWSNFREIDMQISIDGINERFKYIRYPADWDSVSRHVNLYQEIETRFQQLRISISHTVSAYNIYYLPEFLDWCERQGLPRPWLGRLHNPVHMRPSVWLDTAKQFIINRLSQGNEDARTWSELMANSDDSQHFDLFRQRVKWHDQYRGLNFSDTFPEMAIFL